VRGTALPHLPPIAVLLLSSGLILLSCDSATTQAVRVHLVKQCGMRYRLVSAAVKFYFTAAVEAARRGRSRGRAEPNITTDSLRRLCGLETGGDVSK